MRLKRLIINSRFKNLQNIEIDFSIREGITVLIGNNGSGKSNILEAISYIFAGLYNSQFNPTFSYQLEYSKDNYTVEIKFENNSYEVVCNGLAVPLRREYLPSQVISSYSGEEDRLWKAYYEPFYQSYIRALRGAALPNSDLIYINKFYWNIALLTLHFYDFAVFTDIRDFCEKFLGVHKLNSVRLSFDTTKLRNWQPNPVVSFVNAINPQQQESVEIRIEELKARLSYITSQKDFFNYLAAAFMPKDDKLITDIQLRINDDILADSLSEGEKKLLLIKLILEVAGDENSLILLDEPDSHIHISRKQDLKDILKQYENRENIITTHSPTLTHAFDSNHIVMLTKNGNDVAIELKDKQEIVYILTKGLWSYQEQNIFLNSNNDILLVEGKTDEVFLKKALAVLKNMHPRFRDLNFEYLPCGGADGVKLMTSKFRPKAGQSIIALFDSDQAGWDSINKIFERNSNNKYNKNDFGKFRKQGDVFITIYPTRPFYKGGENFNIEDYFSKKILNHFVLKTFKGLDSIVTKGNFKRSLETACPNLDDSEFKYFKLVFDLIIEIKNSGV